MTLVDVIARFDKTRPNSFEYETKRNWLLSLESRIREFVNLHLGNKADTQILENENPAMFLDDSDIDIYVYYLVSMGDLTNAEYQLYNISSTYFNSIYRDWKRRYRGNNVPCKSTSIKT